MKIKGFQIDKFARPALTSGGPVGLKKVSGNDILIRGENQSGKTHTFNAILYSLLGETIALQRGHGNAVELVFSDGSRIFRGQAGKRLETGSEEYGPETADDEIQRRVGPCDLLHTHFLHSRLSELPLENLAQSKIITRVLDATTDDLSDQVNKLQEQVETLEAERERQEAELNSKKRDCHRCKRQLSEIESQVEKWVTVVNLAESGQLEKISNTLQKDPELENRINQLTSEKSGLITDIREKQNEKTRAKELEEETREIIIKALEEFICPVCEERVNRSAANYRLKKKKCPFCNQSTDVKETFEHLETEKQRSEGLLAEIDEELDELEEQKTEVESQIQSLKEKQPEIADLNSYAVRQLRNFDHDLEKIYAYAKDELAKSEGVYDEYSEKLDELEAELTTLKEKVVNKDDEKQSVQQQIKKLENEDISMRISRFEEIWNNHYQEIAPQIAEEIHLRREGDIALVGEGGRSRQYDRRGDLADAEVILLNISFVTTLNQIALKQGSIDWETIVLDEPFSRLDQGLKEDALNYMKDLDIQFVLTSSDPYVWEAFNHASTLGLERQYKITDFTNE